MGDERPGSVIKGPAITVTCDCGERTELFYGERWACPACGRAYDTRQVPEEEYAAIRRVQRRFRALPIALGLAVAALAIFFTLTGQVLSVFVLLPLSVATWFAFIRPLHRRRYRAAIADLPRWNLRAE
jgi:Flp pilus assembly protein TadB